MTSVLLVDALQKSYPKELQTKVNFDRVAEERKMPESGISGDLLNGRSVQDTPLNGNSHTPIIATAPNFHKERGVVMSDEGFIKLPRSLLKSESWRNLRLRQQKVFLYILQEAQYTPYVFKYNGKDIPLKPGEFCIALRRLVDDFNGKVKFRDEKIDLPFLQRAVSAFTKLGLTDTRVDTGITIIRVLFPGIYDDNQNQSDTRSDTYSIQDRYTNEERKEGQDVKETIDRANAPDRSFLLNNKIEEEKTPSVFEAPTPNGSRQKKMPLTEVQKDQYEKLWKYLCQSQMAEGHVVKNSNGCVAKGVKSSDLITWIQTRKFEEIVDVIKRAKDSVVDKTYPGYMSTLFSKNVTKKASNIDINNAYLKEVMKSNKCNHLQDTKQYVQDSIKHIDYQKNSEPQRFKEMIEASLRMAQSYDYQEPKYGTSEEDEDY